MENPDTRNSGNLLGKKIQIELEPAEKETLQKLRARLPQMPTVTGILVKRLRARNWAYIVELGEPFFLDREGIDPQARRKYSTNYLMINMSLTDRNKGKDSFYLELTGRQPDALRGDYRKGESHAWVSCVPDPSLVPNEVSKDDSFWKENPVMCPGWIKLVD